MSLAEASEARKVRLIALRNRKLGQGELSEGGEGNRTFIFKQRNYDPETRTLRKHGATDEEKDTVEKAVEGLAEKIAAEDEERRAQELDLFNIAPKRPNWDLKRDMEKKLGKLERKTQECIHALIRQRLLTQKGVDPSAINLSAGISERQKAAEDQLDDNDSDEE
ncbi:uncharacterized protein EI90DRAFT_3145106 [Cantharellus anzutake]|uniref:uncharacterized protein n=1 Tax=Cantharellus anzutake TaxID=1750568 RepID=UPI0019044437|nr:uncharacterized protein EI90DRAFT_3145106 [Cantharellus anzutake]KAF8334221.1 hypothetical protein EI90DRAFT_3145106 [Cantharellus anzutake]